jgi:copper chaperone CopZ
MNRFVAVAGLSLVSLLIGCGNTEEASTVAIQPVAFNVANAPTVEFNVPDMMCPEGCGEATREILAKQEGVMDVKIDFPAKLAVVAVDREKFNSGDALDELIDKGFENSTVKKSADQ